MQKLAVAGEAAIPSSIGVSGNVGSKGLLRPLVEEGLKPTPDLHPPPLLDQADLGLCNSPSLSSPLHIDGVGGGRDPLNPLEMLALLLFLQNPQFFAKLQERRHDLEGFLNRDSHLLSSAASLLGNGALLWIRH